LTELRRAAALIEGIKAQDAGSANAAAWLRGMCRHLPYEGSTLCISMDALFAEIEEVEADEVFGEREGAA
jgi:hypothetical protein